MINNCFHAIYLGKVFSALKSIIKQKHDTRVHDATVKRRLSYE